MRLIQFIESARDQAEAIVLLHGLKSQVDYRGGRVLPAANGDPWRVQAFFDDSPDAEWLPDGCRHVTVLASMATQLGIEVMQ